MAAPGTVVVVRSWLTGLASVVVVAERTLVDVFEPVDGFTVVVDCPEADGTVLVVGLSPDGGAVVDVSRGIAGSGLTSGSVTVLGFVPPLHAAATSTTDANTAATPRRPRDFTSPPCRR